MTYAVKELFLTLQGEGVNVGRRAVLLRFAGCNLWSGQEQDRAQAICQFCDTDFVGTDGPVGGKFADVDSLADAIENCWGALEEERFIVITGGEPMLQVDNALVDALHARGFYIAMESNGTLAAHPGIDWVCISPKVVSEVVQRSGHELKVVYPQLGQDPLEMNNWAFAHYLIQPMDSIGQIKANLQAAIDFVLAHPYWRLSTQMHKQIGIQ